MKSYTYILTLLTAIFLLGLNKEGFSQTENRPIYLSNPSLEGLSKAGNVGGFGPPGWLDCSHIEQSSVDIQPGHFEVTVPPKSGKTYVGMVVRQDETWEGISQRLSASLVAHQCYKFSIYLARAEIYLSATRSSSRIENFANPTKLRIYGGRGYCGKDELLAESPLIAHEDWRKYDFQFKPTSNYTYIKFEVFYQTPTLFPYNGNLLLDELSDIVPIPCDEPLTEEKVKHPPIVNILSPEQDGSSSETAEFKFRAKLANVPEKSNLTLLINGNRNSFTFNSGAQSVTANFNLRKGENVIQLRADTKDGSSQEKRRIFYDPPVPAIEKPVAFKPQVLTQYSDRKNLSSGKVLPLNKVYFMADSIRIEKENYPILNELKDFLNANPDISIEVMGHTNNRCEDAVCNRLSRGRAKAVVEYLVAQGIKRSRLTYEGYGSHKPVATNNTPTGRKRNQRVEVKITKISS